MVEAIDDDKLRALGDDPAALYARRLIEQLSGEVKRQAQKNAALSLEVARLKRWRFGQSSESLDCHQGELFDAKTQALLQQEEQAEDRAADDERDSPSKRRPKRQPLPGNLERIEHRYEIDSGLCSQSHVLKRIDEEINGQLDCEPARFFVHRHIRGKYVCACCQTVLAAPLPAQLVVKGIPAPGLMAQVIVTKHDDHLPAYRQEEIYARSGARVPRSSIAAWIDIGGVWLQPLADAMRTTLLGQPVLRADETPVAELKPGAGKTHCPTCGCIAARASRWWSTTTAAVAPVSMRASSCVAGQERIGELYRIEQDIREIDPDERLRRRRQDTQPRLHALHAWLREQRSKLAKADATARAIHYALGRWTALGVFADDPLVPIDNNAAERAVRPIALGRKNWLFVGSRQAGERAAALVTLIESAKLCGLDPWACLKDVFTRLPTWPNCQWLDLLPHHWTPPS